MRQNESISKLKPMDLDFIGLKTCFSYFYESQKVEKEVVYISTIGVKGLNKFLVSVLLVSYEEFKEK